MASIGATFTPFHTGIAVARKGTRKPMAPAIAKTPNWNGVRHAGRGRKSERYAPSASAMPIPIAIPKITPSSATWALNSSGLSATSLVGTPSAIAMPISRLWESTIRLVRLKAAKTAPPKIAMASTVLNCRSPSTSAIMSLID